MNVSPLDVAVLASGRRAFRQWRTQLWVQLVLAITAFGVGATGLLSGTNSIWLCGIGFGLFCGSSFQYMYRFEALLGLAERAVSSSARGIELQASTHVQHVA